MAANRGQPLNHRLINLRNLINLIYLRLRAGLINLISLINLIYLRLRAGLINLI